METLIPCFLLGISLLGVHYGCDASNAPRVTVEKGIIEGKTVTLPDLVYNSFQGIPYAKPPIGNRRFKRPKPAEPWQGVLNATNVGSACPQYDQLYLNEYYGEEDCLFLNVYVPIKNFHQPLPVLVNIHGGGFVVGDGGPLIYGPEYVLKIDCIVVTFNYRLGALGFLSLNTAEVPGNAGLKDQALALKWVKKNIAKFGGDENKITLMGLGSGAACVMYHILSPLSTGLFGSAILQSGSALDPWALQKNPKSNAQKLAQILGIGNRTDIAAFLKTIPDKDIVLAAQSELFDDPVKLAFVPTIEKTYHCNHHHLCSKPFITASPQKILESGNINKVHLIIGLSVSDGVFYLTKQFLSPVNSQAILNDCVPDLKHFIPDEILAKCGANGTVEIETKILQKYFPETGNISDSLIHLYTDVAYVLNHVVSIQLLAKYCLGVWVYKYSYTGQKDLTRLTSGWQYPGPGDGDLLAYIFDVDFAGLGQDMAADDLLSTKQMMVVLKNFLVNCNPNPVPTPSGPLIWEQTSPYSITALDYSVQSSTIVDPYADVIQFWGDLAKICRQPQLLPEPENCHHGNNCNVDLGFFHKIYQLISGHFDKCKKPGEDNVILNYLSVQISRLFK